MRYLHALSTLHASMHELHSRVKVGKMQRSHWLQACKGIVSPVMHDTGILQPLFCC